MIRLIQCLILSLATTALMATPLSAVQSAVRVVLVTPTDHTTTDRYTALRRGADMGAAEAVHTAQLTRTQFHFSHRALSASDSALAALDSAHIVISAVEPALRDAMRRHTGALFIDVNAVPSAIACGRRLLYASAPATALADAVLWDARLEKYGAQQVNERFQRASGHTMDGDAWLGWFATKVALELHLRARTAQPDSLASIARSPQVHSQDAARSAIARRRGAGAAEGGRLQGGLARQQPHPGDASGLTWNWWPSRGRG